jgi:adenosylcobinamide kinase/adenosylcobinamide-phosphate guanylyltransferase
MAEITFITGGVRSGKSHLALLLAEQNSTPVCFIATAEAHDEEMCQRICQHRQERPSSWSTIEEPLQLGSALAIACTRASTIIVDDLAIWLSNRLLRDAGDPDTAHWQSQIQHVERALIQEINEALATLPSAATIIFVSAEAGWGIVPIYPLGRAFRDVLGRLNQHIAQRAHSVYLTVAGFALDLRALGMSVHSLDPKKIPRDYEAQSSCT